MILYIEQQARDYPLTQNILGHFPDAQLLFIHHYKNIFDQHRRHFPTLPALILAKQRGLKLFPTPPEYGYPGTSFFLPLGLNCPFRCSYCYLRGLFVNPLPVLFVNIEELLEQLHNRLTSLLERPLTIYANNYSDGLAFDHLTHYTQHLIPFFEQFDDILLEIRTKSHHIDTLLTLPPPRNTEIAFSLNPQALIDTYEHGASSLMQRIEAIRTLLNHHWKVGIRLLPLLPVENIQKIYHDFFLFLRQELPLEKLHSIFLAPLMYSKEQYHRIFSGGNSGFTPWLEEDKDRGLIYLRKEMFAALWEDARKIFAGVPLYVDYQ